jgi:hypothetical protein
MSFIAKLKLDGEEVPVLQCSFRFSQIVDETGKPSALPLGGSIILLLESNSNNDLFDWMISPTQTKSGSVTFYRRDTMSKLKTLEFTDAYCVDYHETFNHIGENPMQIQITLSAREIKLNDSGYKNNWPE